MHPTSPQDDLRRDIQATLAARRDVGPEYDEHFAQLLSDRIAAQIAQARQPAPPAPPSHSPLGSDQRTAIAICSLIFGIPIVAISGGIGGPIGLFFALAALVLINVAATQL